MKTKELIRLLQLEDPSGELECCVGNKDIYFISEEFGGYDGCNEVLIRDSTKSGYNVIGAKINSTDNKIQIHTSSIEDILIDKPELPIEYSKYSEKHYKPRVEEWRKEAKEITEEKL